MPQNKESEEQPTVLPWHRDAAKEIMLHCNDDWYVPMDAAHVIARHDPHATTRTIEQVAQECAEYQLGFETIKVECLTVDEAASIIAATMREVVKCELAAKDAEIARRKAQLEMWTSAAMDGNAVIAQLTARAEKAEADNAQLRTRLERCAHIAASINDPELPLDGGKRLGMIYNECTKI